MLNNHTIVYIVLISYVTLISSVLNLCCKLDIKHNLASKYQILDGNLKHSLKGSSVWYGIVPSQAMVSVWLPNSPNSLCSLQDLPPSIGSGLLHLLNRDIVPWSPLHFAVHGEYRGGAGIHSE